MKDLRGRLQEQALALGAYKAGVVKVADISVDASLASVKPIPAGITGRTICVRRISGILGN